MRLSNELPTDGESARNNHVLALCQIFADLKFFTHRLRNKPFLISLLTTPPHLKYVAALPCNLSLLGCLADINVSQGGGAACAKYGGIFDINSTANLPRNRAVKKNFLNRLRIDRIMVMTELWS